MERTIMERLGLADEPTPGLPLVEIVGGRRVVVEHHCGVTEYTPARITVKIKGGAVTVSGRGLSFARMTASRIVICGTVELVGWEKGAENGQSKA